MVEIAIEGRDGPNHTIEGQDGPSLPATPPKGPLSGTLRGGWRHASGEVVACFANFSRAASAASSVMSQDVPFTSASRPYSLRRYERRRFGSMSNSAASCFGVMSVTPFATVGVSFMPTSSHSGARLSRGSGEYLQTLYKSNPRSPSTEDRIGRSVAFSGNLTSGNPPLPPPRRWSLTKWIRWCSAEGAQTVVFAVKTEPRMWRIADGR